MEVLGAVSGSFDATTKIITNNKTCNRDTIALLIQRLKSLLHKTDALKRMGYLYLLNASIQYNYPKYELISVMKCLICIES
jgi:hypothetical protein